MDALIITAPGEMTAPPSDVEYLPDISSNLYWQLRVSDFTGMTDGAALSAPLVTSRGSAPLADRTFGTGNDWTMPIYRASGGPNGGPYLDFTTTQRLGNAAGTNTVLSNPYTLYCVARVRTWVPSTLGFMLFPVTTAGATYVYPTLSSGNKTFEVQQASGNQQVPTSAAWAASSFSVFAMIVGPTGTSRIKVGSNAILATNLNPATNYKGLVMGGANFNRGSSTGMDGSLVEVGMFNRALSDADLNGLYADCSERYAIV